MERPTFIACDACESEGEVVLPRLGAVGPLACPTCGALPTVIDVGPWQPEIEARVSRMTNRLRAGRIGSRKQALGRSDAGIDRDGREAELAACLLLCPGFRKAYLARDAADRGNDLPAEWTVLPKGIEVKQTRYCDDRRGYLLIRPPRKTPGPMRTEYIDDCLYVLMSGRRGFYHFLGWADRTLILAAGKLNPIPVQSGQRECWGIHWKRLHPAASLCLTEKPDHG